MFFLTLFIFSVQRCQIVKEQKLGKFDCFENHSKIFCQNTMGNLNHQNKNV